MNNKKVITEFVKKYRDTEAVISFKIGRAIIIKNGILRLINGKIALDNVTSRYIIPAKLIKYIGLKSSPEHFEKID